MLTAGDNSAASEHLKRGSMDYGTLPYTGGGLAIGSLLISQSWLLLIALMFVMVGTLCIRFGWRRGKAGNEL